MTAVPYIFATQNGNIPLSELDANFATLANAVPAYADAAGIATIATTAGSAGFAATVTANAQANITSVGTLAFLDVAGNVSANYFIGNGSTLTGVVGNATNLTGTVLNSNIVTSSLTTVGNLISLSVVGNVQANNVSNLQNLTVLNTAYIFDISSTGTAGLTTVTAATVSATGNVSTASNVIANGNVQAGNLRTTGVISSTGNVVTAGNITGNFIFGNGSQLTGIDATSIQNGTANVRTFLNGNVTVSAGGTANVLNVTSTGTITTGTATVGNLLTGGNISATGNVTGNGIFAINVVTNFISSDDSTAVTIEDGVIINGDIEVAGQAVIANSVTVPNLVTNNISSDDSTAVTIDEDVTLIGDLDVTGGVRVFGGPLQLPSFTADQIANISAVNGDLIYNSTINKFQGYENGAWANII
jgi:hypothetical protein